MADDSITRYLTDHAGDADPVETAEWRDAFLALVATHGPARARFVLDELAVLARSPAVAWSPELVTPYVNTIPVERQPVFPGDLALEEGWTVVPAQPASGKRVLVVGAGPSGLSTAWHLALLGHTVIIHEAGPLAGGMMHFGIPKYRPYS